MDINWNDKINEIFMKYSIYRVVAAFEEIPSYRDKTVARCFFNYLKNW